MFWSRVVTAACSLMIWHYNHIIAAQIAFPWDTSRGLIYQTGKLLVSIYIVHRLSMASVDKKSLSDDK